MPVVSVKTGNRAKGSIFGEDDYFGLGKFIVGCFLIPFSLVLLWKNERKVVYFTRTVDLGRSACRSAIADWINDANEFELVHLCGDTHNPTNLIDEDFGLASHNAYRLTRKVEMYQWREIRSQDE